MSSKLNEMIESVDETNEGIDNSITQLNSQIEEIQSQIDEIESSVLEVATGDMTSYLEDTKIIEIGGSYIEYPSEFGISTISNFKIYDILNIVVYEYNGTGWDNDTKIKSWISDFDFSYDYLHKEMGTEGIYGLYPKLDQLEMGKTLLQANKQKYTDSKTIFSKYT